MAVQEIKHDKKKFCDPKGSFCQHCCYKRFCCLYKPLKMKNLRMRNLPLLFIMILLRPAKNILMILTIQLQLP